YRPFTYQRPDGTFEGFDIDAARRLGADLGVKVRFVSTSWPQLVEGLREGRYDIAMSGITRNLERQKIVSLSDPYLLIGKCLLIRRADRARFTDLKAIDRLGVRIGVNPGGTNESFVRDRINTADVVVIEDNLSIPDAVAEGRVDVMLTDNVEAVLVANRDPRLFAVSPDSPLTHDELSYMLPRDDAAFLDWVNLWLRQMALDGELERLREKWIDVTSASRSKRSENSSEGAGIRLLEPLGIISRPTVGRLFARDEPWSVIESWFSQGWDSLFVKRTRLLGVSSAESF
ncbi:MAG: hypothetical protein CL489_11540, partial [Acidobacteria bacterium]|nr:hypothetical protein [Acidobacteriota bacterium]